MTNAEAITNYLENENVFSPTLDNERLALEILDILSINPSEKLKNERWASTLYPTSPPVR